jgi:hypothetical protein
MVVGRGREGHVYASCVTRLEKVQVRRITDLAKRTNGTPVPLSGFLVSLHLHIAWPLSKNYTAHHPGYIAQFRVAIKDFKANPVSLDTSKQFIEISILLTYSHGQNLVRLPLNAMITQARTLLIT